MDETSFENVVNAHYEPLYRFALSLACNEPDAGYLVQQTFCRWATHGGQLRDKSKVKSWLFTTLHREFLGQRRHEDKFQKVEISTEGGEELAAESVFRRTDNSMVSVCFRPCIGWMKTIARH
jgi:DNA-directed RNA polymerase specialized sigma24 family protein